MATVLQSPDLQRRAALRHANYVRSRRAELKRDLKEGRQPIYGLLVAPPEYLESARILDVLLAVPKYGRVKANRVLAQCRISPSRTVGGLTDRQRRELARMVDRG